MKLNENETIEDLQYKGLKIVQSKKLYRFTTDAVLLANFAKAKKGDNVVDLCSGSGVIGVLVQAKTNASQVVLVELQQALADMSQKTIELNKLQEKVKVVCAPLQGIAKQIGTEQFQVVVCNPPYKMQHTSLLSKDESMNICKHEIAVTLQEIVTEASKLLQFGGLFYTINKEERLVDLMVALRKNNLEPKELVVVPSAKGSSLIMVKAKKGGKSGVRVNVQTV